MTATRLYNEFTAHIEQMLISIINNSRVKSKHYGTNVIKIDIDRYTDMCLVDKRLVLCDAHGYQYSIYSVDLSELCAVIDHHNQHLP